MSVFALAGALAAGVAFGYASQRGVFCMSSGMLGAPGGDRVKLEVLALAVAVQLVLLPLLFASGLARAGGLQLAPVAAGGFVFGLSMRWAGGCAAATLLARRAASGPRALASAPPLG